MSPAIGPGYLAQAHTALRCALVCVLIFACLHGARDQNVAPFALDRAFNSTGATFSFECAKRMKCLYSKIKRLSMYSTLYFYLRSALGVAPLDVARKKIIGDNQAIFFHWACLLAYEIGTSPVVDQQRLSHNPPKYHRSRDRRALCEGRRRRHFLVTVWFTPKLHVFSQ
jgi:hypothetical protein